MKEIPYDYVAKFRLKGLNGNRVEEVINISVDGAFVTTAIGYSFIPAPVRDFSTDVIGVFSAVADTLLNTDEAAVLQRCLMVRLCGIDFKYSIIDSATGRELQNLAIHNIAGLGEPNGGRPFRPMAKPMLFLPRSTIRIVIEEVSEGLDIYGYESPEGSGQRIGAELFVVFHGYKILGYGTA
jgi:hypothetical protein